MIEVHAVNARHQRRRQKYNGSDGENLDDLVLFDIDKPLCVIHQEIDFLEQETGVRYQRIHVPMLSLE